MEARSSVPFQLSKGAFAAQNPNERLLQAKTPEAVPFAPPPSQKHKNNISPSSLFLSLFSLLLSVLSRSLSPLHIPSTEPQTPHLLLLLLAPIPCPCPDTLLPSCPPPGAPMSLLGSTPPPLPLSPSLPPLSVSSPPSLLAPPPPLPSQMQR